MLNLKKVMKTQGVGVASAFSIGLALGINFQVQQYNGVEYDSASIMPNKHEVKREIKPNLNVVENEILPTLDIAADILLDRIEKINPVHAKIIGNYYDLALKEQEKYGFPASVKLAQMIVEGGYSEKNPKGSRLVIEANNPFGIKYFGEGVPERVQKWDELVHPGEWALAVDDCKGSKCKFVKFKGIWHAFRYHSEFMTGVDGFPSHYAKYVTIGDWQDWLYAIKKGGYATSKTYYNDLRNIIEKYNLHYLDQFANERP